MTLRTVAPCAASNAVHMCKNKASLRSSPRLATRALPVDMISEIAEGTDMALAVGSIAGVTALSAALIASDPVRGARRVGVFSRQLSVVERHGF